MLLISGYFMMGRCQSPHSLFSPIILSFLPTSLRMARTETRTRYLEPWMIALIVLAVFAVVALVVGLLVYFLVYGECINCYQSIWPELLSVFKMVSTRLCDQDNL